MKRSRVPVPLGATALLLALLGCQEAPRESPEGAAAPPAQVPAAAPAVETPASGAFLDPDAATREELLAVPNVDAALADAIIAGRPFADMVALDRVLATRLDEAQRDTVYTRLWRPIDLNTASGEEILLVPGVGERMRHEFEEYRPYRGIEQFRREIGKYVDDAEVARLERYVTIR